MTASSVRRVVRSSKPNSLTSSSNKTILQSKCSNLKEPSVWDIRNNSTNVSQLLAPHVLDNASEISSSVAQSRCSRNKSPKYVVYSKPMCKSHQLRYFHCESCYCRQPPIPPRMFLRPRTGENEEKEKMAHRPSLINLCSEATNPLSIDFRGEYPSGRRESHQEDPDHTDLNYTKDRDLYEQKFPEAAKKNVARSSGSSSASGKIKSRKQSHVSDGQSNRSGLTDSNRLKTKEFTNTNSDGLAMTESEFQAITDFRKDQYFDCHSVTNLADRDVPDHKCVHKFMINERLLPEPINCNSFGISCCEICNKPMERYQCEKPLPKPIPKEKKVPSNIQRLYHYEYVPPRVNIGTGKERIEIKVPENVTNECFGGSSSDVKMKIRKSVQSNSFALRFQKGII